MSARSFSVDDCRERLDVIDTLADMIAEAHCSTAEPPSMDSRQVCKLSILIGELCEQADKMLETFQAQASLKAVAGGEA